MVALLARLAALAVLVLGPALCFGGVIEHACDCGNSGVEESCEHEATCSDDPCSTLALAPDQDQVGKALQLALHEPASLVARAPAALATRVPEPRAPPLRCNLPYAQSDRPLLI